MADIPDWLTVHEALRAEGFVEAGHGRSYIRFGWPGTTPPNGPLLLSTDPTAPEHGQLLETLLATLLQASDRGTAAHGVLEAVSET